MTARTRLRQLPGLIFLLALLVMAAVLLKDRDAIVTVNARTETMRFAVCDETNLVHLGTAKLARVLGGSYEEVTGWLAVNSGTRVEATRAGTGALALSLSHDKSVGTLNDDPLGHRVWLNVPRGSDSGFVLPFVGEFTIGSLVGPTTEAVLLDGTVEVIESAFLAHASYVNLQVNLLPGDHIVTHVDGKEATFVCPKPPESESNESGEHTASSRFADLPRGFVHLPAAGNKAVSGFYVRAETTPDVVQLRRSPRRPAIRLNPSPWGRLREGTEFGILVFILTCVAAIAQTLSFFASSDRAPRLDRAQYDTTDGGSRAPISAATAGHDEQTLSRPEPRLGPFRVLVAAGGILLALDAVSRYIRGKQSP